MNNSKFSDVHTQYTLHAYHSQFGGGALAVQLNTLSSDWLGKKSNICFAFEFKSHFLWARSLVLHVTEIEQPKFMKKIVRFFYETT